MSRTTHRSSKHRHAGQIYTGVHKVSSASRSSSPSASNRDSESDTHCRIDPIMPANSLWLRSMTAAWPALGETGSRPLGGSACCPAQSPSLGGRVQGAAGDQARWPRSPADWTAGWSGGRRGESGMGFSKEQKTALPTYFAAWDAGLPIKGSPALQSTDRLPPVCRRSKWHCSPRRGTRRGRSASAPRPAQTPPRR